MIWGGGSRGCDRFFFRWIRGSSIYFYKKKIYPIISTHYEREYLISADNLIRATVDFNLESIHLKNFSQINKQAK